METLTVTNPTSKKQHLITFSTRPSSIGKIVINQNGRSVGKINIASKLVFCEKPEILDAVTKNIDSIVDAIV